MNGDLLNDLEKNNIVTLNKTNRFILLEFPSNFVPHYTEELFFKLRLKGITPIIAHPERNQELIENPNRLYTLVINGALTQVTASSLIGNFGKKINHFCLQLIEHNLTHIIASDAHNITTRAFHLQEAYNIIEKKIGIATITDFKENAYSVINGIQIYKKEPELIRKKGFYFFDGLVAKFSTRS